MNPVISIERKKILTILYVLLYFLVFPTLLRMRFKRVWEWGGGGIKSLKTENIAHRNYHKSTVYKTLYVFIVRVQVSALFLY